jgi:hypothetical protein
LTGIGTAANGYSPCVSLLRRDPPKRRLSWLTLTLWGVASYFAFTLVLAWIH